MSSLCVFCAFLWLILFGHDGAGFDRVMDKAQRISQNSHLQLWIIRLSERRSRNVRPGMQRSRRARRFRLVWRDRDQHC
jgi:hypothetical protein